VRRTVKFPKLKYVTDCDYDQEESGIGTEPRNTVKIDQGIMIRGARSKDWNYCIAINSCPKTHITNCLVHGLEADEIKKMKCCLRESMSYASEPMLLPVILLEQKIHHFARLLERRAETLETIEHSTGIRHGSGEQNLTLQKRMEQRAKLDFDSVTLELTGMLGTLSFCDLTCQASLRGLEMVEAVAGTGGLAENIRKRVAYLKGLIAGAQDTRRLLEARTQAQVQHVSQHFCMLATVCRCLILFLSCTV
jgi:hypothetical protein